MRPAAWWVVASLAAALLGIFARWDRYSTFSSGIQYERGKYALAYWTVLAVACGIGIARRTHPGLLYSVPFSLLFVAHMIYNAVRYVDNPTWGVTLLALASVSLLCAQIVCGLEFRRRDDW